MNESNIEKSNRPSSEDILTAIQSFNDPAIITNIFQELGWNYSIEIKETLMMAKQNANLSIKFKALKHLRELLREAAETSGYIANVSSSAPNAQGGHTTFHAKRIAGILNPVKKIESTEIKETQDDKKRLQSIESPSRCGGGIPDRGSDRGQSQDESRPAKTDSPEPIRDTGCAFPIGDVESGGIEPKDGSETSGPGEQANDSANSGSNPCIKTRPPTCDRDLFRGISSAEEV